LVLVFVNVDAHPPREKRTVQLLSPAQAAVTGATEAKQFRAVNCSLVLMGWAAYGALRAQSELGHLIAVISPGHPHVCQPFRTRRSPCCPRGKTSQ
jgi:hypothetical protein